MRKEKQKIKRFLTMRFSGELFGIDMENVRDIMINVRIEKPHGLSVHIAGIFKKGNIPVPIIDVRGKLGIKQCPESDEPCIVLAETENSGAKILFGFAAGSGLEALEVNEDEIIPHINETGFLEGFAACRHKTFKILKLKSLCSLDDIKASLKTETPVLV